MPTTIEQDNLSKEIEKNDIISTNKSIRTMIAAGTPTDVIAKKFSKFDGIDSNRLLGSMAMAERFDMPVNEAYQFMPQVLESAYGKNYHAKDFVKDFYAQDENFTLPYDTKRVSEFAGDVAGEEKEAGFAVSGEGQPSRISAFEEEGEFPTGIDRGMLAVNGGFNQAWAHSNDVFRDSTRGEWFNPSNISEKFLENLLNAETDEDMEGARKTRLSELLVAQTDRVQKLKDFEDKMQVLSEDPPDVWLSKVNAWRRGSATVTAATMDSVSDTMGLLGAAFGSSSMKDASKGASEWARAYHKTIDMPEMLVESVNPLDDMTNSFIQTAPFIGASIAAAFVSPDKVTPLALFAVSASVEGSSIRQTSLDAGIPERSARMRGWIGGAINGALEAGGGGVTKYSPKKLITKIAKFPGKLTKTALREFLREELPQEVISAVLSDDVPMDDMGEVDWGEVTDRVLILARDTAFMSSIMTTGGSATGQVMGMRAEKSNQRTAQAMQDAFQTVAEELNTPEVSEVETVEVTEEVDGVETTVPETKELDQIEIETPPEADPIELITKETPPFGVFKGEDGKYSVLNWETQQEVTTGMTQKKAVDEAKALNKGDKVLPISRARDVLPTSQDIETLTHTELLNAVFTKVSQQAQKVATSIANSQTKIRTDLAGYARTSLKGLDISKSQANSLVSKVALAKTEEQRVAAIQTVEVIKEISKQRKQTSKFKKLRSLINRNSKKRLRDGGIHYSAYESLQGILNNYTTLSPKLLNSIKRSKEYMDKLRTSVAEGFGSAYAEAAVPKSVTDKFSDLTATPLKDMTSAEIEGLNNTLSQFLKINQTYSRLLQNKQMREAKNFLNNATADVKLNIKPKGSRRFAPKRSAFKKLGDVLVGIKNDDVYTIATRIWGRFDPVSSIIMSGRRNQLALSNKYVGMLRDMMQKNQIDPTTLKQWSQNMHVLTGQRVKGIVGGQVQLYDVKLGGKNVQFTMAELMSLVMHTRNSHNARALVKNGIATRDDIIGNVTPKEFDELLGIVERDPGAMAMIDWMESFYIEMAQDINKTSRELDGIDIASIDNYFHVEYVSEGGVIGTEYVRDALVDEEGRLKARTSSSRPVVLRDMFEVITEDIGVVSNFAGTTKSLRQLRSLVNYLPFRQKMKDVGAEFVLDEMGGRVASMQRSRQPAAGDLERLIQKVDSRLATAVLVNPKIWALQPMSMSLYATEASAKYMTAIKPRVSTGIAQDLMDNWVMLKARASGTGSSSSLANASQIKKIFTDTGNFTDKVMSGMHKSDLYAIIRAGQVVMAEMSDPNLSGTSLAWWRNQGANPYTMEYGSDEFWTAFNERADFIVTRTQPMFFSENKSSFTGSDNPLVRSLSRYRSFVDQVGRIMRRSRLMQSYGDISRAEMSKNMALTIGTASVMSVLVKYMFDLLMGKEKDEGDLFRDIATSPLSLMPFIGYPAKQIADAMLGGDGPAPEFSSMPIMLVDSILENSWKIAKGINKINDDEIIQSGPNRGEFKSEQLIKDGIKGIISDALLINGAPVRTIENIEWWKE